MLRVGRFGLMNLIVLAGLIYQDPESRLKLLSKSFWSHKANWQRQSLELTPTMTLVGTARN
jgi:hypothetical protein